MRLSYKVDGVKYQRRIAAAKELNVGTTTISNYIKKGRGYYRNLLDR